MHLILLFILRLVALLPLSLARGLGVLIGYCAWLFNSKVAKVTKVNLQHCYPQLTDGEVNKLARQSVLQWGITLLEIPVVWGHPTDWSRGKIKRYKNLELYEQLKAEGKGVIIVAPHLGNWEVVGLYWSVRTALTNMFSPTGNEELDDWVKAVRGRSGSKLAPANNRGVIMLVKALKNNEAIGILPDQVPQQGSGEFAPFFGKPAYTMTLVHNLLGRTGAKAIFCYAKRIKGGFELVCEPAPEQLYSNDDEVALAGVECRGRALRRRRNQSIPVGIQAV